MIRFEGEFRMWYEVQHLTISRFLEMISFYFDYFSNFEKVRKRKMLFAVTKSNIRYRNLSRKVYKKKKPLARLFFLCYLDKIDACFM